MRYRLDICLEGLRKAAKDFRISCVPVNIGIESLQNTTLQHYRLATLFAVWQIVIGVSKGNVASIFGVEA
jgi:hypothetical protein